MFTGFLQKIQKKEGYLSDAYAIMGGQEWGKVHEEIKNKTGFGLCDHDFAPGTLDRGRFFRLYE